MGTFADDVQWQMKFSPAVQEVVTDAFGIDDCDFTYTQLDSDDDRRRNTDIFLRVDGRVFRMSQRIRRYVIGDEFTLRYVRPDTPTEWQKLWAGFGDYLFYGQGVDRDRSVRRWFIGSMAVFRDWVRAFIERGENPPHILKSNRDGSSEFVAFSRGDLPAEFTIAQDETAEEVEAAWAIVKDSRGLYATGHGAAVRWARAVLGLDDRGTHYDDTAA